MKQNKEDLYRLLEDITNIKACISIITREINRKIDMIDDGFDVLSSNKDFSSILNELEQRVELLGE